MTAPDMRGPGTAAQANPAANLAPPPFALGWAALRTRPEENGEPVIDEHSGDPAAWQRLPEGLLAAGVVFFGAGALAAVATLLPLFLQSERLPTAVYLLAVILSPLGLGLCLLSLLAESRRRRRTVQR